MITWSSEQSQSSSQTGPLHAHVAPPASLITTWRPAQPISHDRTFRLGNGPKTNSIESRGFQAQRNPDLFTWTEIMGQEHTQQNRGSDMFHQQIYNYKAFFTQPENIHWATLHHCHVVQINNEQDSELHRPTMQSPNYIAESKSCTYCSKLCGKCIIRRMKRQISSILVTSD